MKNLSEIIRIKLIFNKKGENKLKVKFTFLKFMQTTIKLVAVKNLICNGLLSKLPLFKNSISWFIQHLQQ